MICSLCTACKYLRCIFFLLIGQSRFSPRSFMPQEYPVQFPLARPSLDNIQAICLHSDHRPRYPDSYFPSSGFGSQRRRASAVNNAESWFSMCCQGNQTWGTDVTLCCATQAVSLTFSKCNIRTRHLVCCHPRSALLLLFLIGLIVIQHISQSSLT